MRKMESILKHCAYSLLMASIFLLFAMSLRVAYAMTVVGNQKEDTIEVLRLLIIYPTCSSV